MKAAPEHQSGGVPPELGAEHSSAAMAEIRGGGPQGRTVTHQLWLLWSVSQWHKSPGVMSRARQQQGQGPAEMALAWGRVLWDRIQGAVKFSWKECHSPVLACVAWASLVSVFCNWGQGPTEGPGMCWDGMGLGRILGD